MGEEKRDVMGGERELFGKPPGLLFCLALFCLFVGGFFASMNW